MKQDKGKYENVSRETFSKTVFLRVVIDFTQFVGKLPLQAEYLSIIIGIALQFKRGAANLLIV